MPNCNQLIIDLETIGQNLDTIKSILPPQAQIMPMVKASAYGTDPIVLAKYFVQKGITQLGVSYVEEGQRLREQGVNIPIFVISVPPFEAKACARYTLTPSLSSFEEADALNKAANNKQIPVHVNINTGMNRFGIEPELAYPLIQKVIQSPGLRFSGLYTHFATAENSQFDIFTRKQIEIFKDVVHKCPHPPKWIHMSNSAATLRFSLPFCNLFRIGLLLFGIYPFEERQHSLHCALTLKSYIVRIAHCQKGERVGYGEGFTVTKSPMKIAVLPIGYHDGIPLQQSNRGYVLIHEKKAPKVGRICMDFMMVDITDIPEANLGDDATLFGPRLPPEEVASWVNTNVRELITTLGPRIKRTFTSGSHEHKPTTLSTTSSTL